MRYRNIKTGIEFTSSCVLSGEDYEEIKPKVAAPKAAPKAEPIVEPVKAPEKKAPKTVKKVETKRAKK